MTIALYVTEEMCARMAVVTGKGLSDLIREEFGFRPTFFVMVTGLMVDLGNVVAEFAGVAASHGDFRHQPSISPCRWRRLSSGFWFCAAPTGRSRRFFWSLCTFYLAYIFSAILAQAGLAAGGAEHGDSRHSSAMPAIC